MAGIDGWTRRFPFTVPGTRIIGGIDYKATLNPGTAAEIQPTYTVEMVHPVYAPTPVRYTYSSGFKSTRCDRKVSAVGGCVHPSFSPDLFLSEAEHGESAALVKWAQANMRDHWGVYGIGQPLQYLESQTEADRNRAFICDSTFIPNKPFDSCDEWAFAKTHQSARKLGVPSSTSCAEVTVVYDGNRYSVQPGKFNGTERCVRGHVIVRDNELAGLAYANLVTAQRLLDKDKFWVNVS